MQGKVVLVCTDEIRTWRQLSAPLAGAGNRVLQAAATDRALELIRSAAVDLVFYDWASQLDRDAVLAAAGGRVPVVGLAGEDRRAAILDLVCDRGVLNVCSPRVDDSGQLAYDAGELVATSEKILRRDCFGLDKYLAGFGIELNHQVVVRAEERDLVVDRLTQLVRSLGAGRRVAESVALVADELITNAIYNAPRGPDGVPRYAQRSRRDKITLRPTEYVRVDYGSDGRRFGLAVIDSFGALHPNTLRSGVRRCLTAHDPIEQKAGGAGLGLYTALSQANQLVINLEPGTRTEVIAVWDLGRRGRGAGAAAGSVHVFATDELTAARRRASTDINGVDAVPEPTVTLSDSVRRDIVAAVGGDAMVTLAGTGRHLSLMTAHTGHRPGTATASGEIGGDGPPTSERIGDLLALRGLLLLRRVDRPGLDTTLGRLRGATTLAPGLEAVLTHLINRWQAAALLCRVGDQLIPWTAAGDLESWEELSAAAIPLASGRAGAILPPMDGDERVSDESGWLDLRLTGAGVSVGALELDALARRLGDLMIGQVPGDGVAVSISMARDVSLVFFACRPRRAEPLDEPLRYELLQRETAALCRRVEDRIAPGPVLEAAV